MTGGIIGGLIMGLVASKMGNKKEKEEFVPYWKCPKCNKTYNMDITKCKCGYIRR